MKLPALITATPDIATQGSWILVCYDFSQGAKSPVMLLVQFSGLGVDIYIEVSIEEPCERVYIPPGCTGVIIEDKSGQSLDCGVIVSPP